MEEILKKIDRYIELYKTPPTGREVQGTVELLEQCKDIICQQTRNAKDNGIALVTKLQDY